jgi:hypothetical protein
MTIAPIKPKTWAEVLRDWLQREAFTPEQAAINLDCSVGTIYRYLAGETVLPATKARTTAARMGIKPAVLAGVLAADRSRLHAPKSVKAARV